MPNTASAPAPAEGYKRYDFQNVSIVKMDFISKETLDESNTHKLQKKEKTSKNMENASSPSKKDSQASAKKSKKKTKTKRIGGLQTNPVIVTPDYSEDDSVSDNVSTDNGLEGGSDSNSDDSNDANKKALPNKEPVSEDNK